MTQRAFVRQPPPSLPCTSGRGRAGPLTQRMQKYLKTLKRSPSLFPPSVPVVLGGGGGRRTGQFKVDSGAIRTGMGTDGDRVWWRGRRAAFKDKDIRHA